MRYAASAYRVPAQRTPNGGLMRFLSALSTSPLAFDVGTATIRACSETSAIIERPSAVREELEGAVIHRRALRGGVVCDVAAAAEAIAPVIAELSSRRRRPGALVFTPSDASAAERERLMEAVSEAGAAVVAVVPEPLAAAVGAGLDMSSEYAQLLVDLGEGVTDVALIAGGAILRTEARRIGCADLRRPLIEWLQWHRRMVVDDAAAEAVVQAFCSRPQQEWFEVRGHDIDEDQPAVHALRREDVALLLDVPLDSISTFVGGVFRRLPDVRAVEVIESGAYLTGGGALLDLLVQRIARRTGLRCVVAPDPLHGVIAGAQRMLGSRALESLAQAGEAAWREAAVQ